MIRRALFVVALLTVAPMAAHASRTQESTFQDDNHLIYTTPDAAARTMDRLKALGADRLRITVLWKAIAPPARPAGFDGSNPDDYPRGAWDNYDTVVRLAAERGLGVNFNVTVPGPLWAMGASPRADIADRFRPNAAEFGDFVRALGRRYPQVTYWSIQNEPNQPGWLDPQWVRSRGRWVAASPAIYRGLVDAAWQALQDTGHGGDTILIGETAPKGVSVRGTTRAMAPGPFIRGLYAGASRRAHPGLFRSTGWAHHPYELIFAPNRRPAHSDWFTIANLGRLESLLARLRGRTPLYLTEFGYQTDPPDPFGVTPAEQARYLNQAEYIAYRNGSVRTLSQFLLYDDGPPFGLTFQSGLDYLSGRAKPAQAAYALALWLPSPNAVRGHRLHVWGLLRAAPNGQSHTVDVLFRARGGAFRRIARLRSQAARGYVDGFVRVPRSGAIRLRWGAARSRTASFRVP